MSVHPTSVIQIEFLRFHLGLRITRNVIPIFIAAQDDIADVFDSTGINFGLKILSFQSPSLTTKESVVHIINRLITIDAI